MADTFSFGLTNTAGFPPGPAPWGTITLSSTTFGTAQQQVLFQVALNSDIQFDTLGFNSLFGGTLTLDCFTFGTTTCTSGTGLATLNQSGGQQDGFGNFTDILNTGLNGGSACCSNTFNFIISAADGFTNLTPADFEALSTGGNGGFLFAGHIANGGGSSFIATGGGTTVPEPATLVLLGSGLLGMAGGLRKTLKV
jgi:hypothetical protein